MAASALKYVLLYCILTSSVQDGDGDGELNFISKGCGAWGFILRPSSRDAFNPGNYKLNIEIPGFLYTVSLAGQGKQLRDFH